MDAYNSHISLSQNGHFWENKIQVVCITVYTVHLWMVNPAFFDLIGHLSHFDIDERSLRLWSEAPMCSDHAHLRRLAQVNSNTLIVFIAPNRLCDFETLLHQNVHQYAVFPIAHVPAIIPLRATVGTHAVGCRPLAYMHKNIKLDPWPNPWKSRI